MTAGKFLCLIEAADLIARFFFVQNSKTGKIIPNGYKIFSIAVK
jgi:hypothetical protein